jgi:hypothetical protein
MLSPLLPFSSVKFVVYLFSPVMLSAAKNLLQLIRRHPAQRRRCFSESVDQHDRKDYAQFFSLFSARRRKGRRSADWQKCRGASTQRHAKRSEGRATFPPSADQLRPNRAFSPSAGQLRPKSRFFPVSRPASPEIRQNNAGPARRRA